MCTSGHSVRHYFEMCFYAEDGFTKYKEEIQNFDKRKRKVIFKRIFVSGMYPDGQYFDGKEDHVWMDDSGFESFHPGTGVSFTAEIYRYLKTGNGKQIDFALRNPECIEKTREYKLPTDEALLKQSMDSLICETCMPTDQCYGAFCMNKRWREDMWKSMFDVCKEK